MQALAVYRLELQVLRLALAQMASRLSWPARPAICVCNLMALRKVPTATSFVREPAEKSICWPNLSVFFPKQALKVSNIDIQGTIWSFSCSPLDQATLALPENALRPRIGALWTRFGAPFCLENAGLKRRQTIKL